MGDRERRTEDRSKRAGTRIGNRKARMCKLDKFPLLGNGFAKYLKGEQRESKCEHFLVRLRDESVRPILILCFLTAGLASSET